MSDQTEDATTPSEEITYYELTKYPGVRFVTSDTMKAQATQARRETEDHWRFLLGQALDEAERMRDDAVREFAKRCDSVGEPWLVREAETYLAAIRATTGAPLPSSGARGEG